MVCHDVVHPLANVFGGLPFVLNHKLDPTLHFFDTCAKIPFAELSGLVDKRHAVQINKVEDFNCYKNEDEN